MKVIFAVIVSSVSLSAFAASELDAYREDRSVNSQFSTPGNTISKISQCLIASPLVGGIIADKGTRQDSQRESCQKAEVEAEGFGSSADRISK